MASVGGSIESISIRSRLFPVAADADTNLKLGGFENELKANGDGSARSIKTRMPWSCDGLTIEIDHDRGDLEFLQEVANGFDMVAFTITMASGVTYQARGTIVGEIKSSSQNATADITISGPGEAEQQ